MSDRKVIQIACMPADASAYHHNSSPALYALCDDGSMWGMSTDEQWRKVKPIPAFHFSEDDAFRSAPPSAEHETP